MQIAQRPHRSKQGSAVLMAIVAMALFAGMGLTALSLLTGDHANRTASLANEQAQGLAQAGVEFAKNRIDQGANPSVTNVREGVGTFTVTATPATNTLVSVGHVATQQKTYTLTTPFAKDCVALDTSQAHSAGRHIDGVKFTKSCLSKAVITNWQLSWTPDLGERTTLLQVQGQQLTTLYDNPIGYSSGTVIDSVDYELKDNGTTPVNKIDFDANVPAGKTYTLMMVMSDGSQVSSTFIDN